MTDQPSPMDPLTSLAAAVAHIQQKFPEVSKGKTAVVQTKTGGSYSYDYADLTDVSRVLLPLLGEVGLSFIARPTLNAAGKFVLAYKLLHITGQYEEGEYPLVAAGGREMGTPQEVGGLITYARRYALCSVTGVAPEGDDDDGAAASRTGTAQRRPPAQRPQQTARRATPAGPPLPGEQIPPPPEPAGPPASGLPQIQRAMHATFNKLGVTDRDARLRVSSRIVNRPLASSNDLTEDEMHTLLDALGVYVDEGEGGRSQVAALAAPDQDGTT